MEETNATVQIDIGTNTVKEEEKNDKYDKTKTKTTGWKEIRTVLALIFFYVSIVIKGLAYSNSAWANSYWLDVYKNLEQFPFTVQFLHQTNDNYNGECEEITCKIFFQNYNAQRTVNDVLVKENPSIFFMS